MASLKFQIFLEFTKTNCRKLTKNIPLSRTTKSRRALKIEEATHFSDTLIPQFTSKVSTREPILSPNGQGKKKKKKKKSLPTNRNK